MSVLKANCPSCAAPIEFQKGSTIVLICPFCRSAVSRTDRGLEDLGKVAEIVDSESPLKIGLKGDFKGNSFELTGRAQLRHELGGFWDEWYATFSNGWVGWLAEAQGKFYLTFYQPLPTDAELPPFEQLQLGQTIEAIPNQTLMVTEKGTATAVAADGEIPYKFESNQQSNYADLTGRDNAFGTIDYSLDPPWTFVGNEVTLEEIGLGDAKLVQREAQKVSTAGMGCPNCGGPLTLTAPDKAERVTCPYCNSLLDVNRGNLSFLRSLTPSPEAESFVLPIGAEGSFQENVKFKIIGAVVRSVTIEGIKYFWHEYLLYNPRVGFRWLVHSDNHWNFVEPANPAEIVVNQGFGKTTATYQGRTYKIFQDAAAVVEYVKGEFYWRVEQGETVRAIDFVAPPLMLSQEISNNEMNWSVGVYQTNEEIEKTFGVTNLPKPWSVAPNQPFKGGFYIKWGFALLGLLCIVAIFMLPFSSSSTVMDETLTFQPTSDPANPQIIFSQPFELKGNRNVQISAGAPVNNSAVYLDVDLVNDQDSVVETIEDIPVTYYQGVEDGESWSEGNKETDVTLSSLPAGKYTLRVKGTLENVSQPLPVSVKVEQNVSRGVNFCCAFVVLAIFPFLGLFRKWTFESRRWGESMFGGTSSGDSDD